MKKLLVVAVLAVGAAGAWYYTQSGAASPEGAAAAGAGAPGAGNAGAGRGGAGGGRGGSGRPALTVDTAAATRANVTEYITVVGNLIGQATVDVVPRVAGRLDAIQVKLGDRVSRGQMLVKIEDRELQQQVKQAEQSLEVNKATVTQRQSDLQLRKTTLARQQELFKGGLSTRQTVEDAEASFNSAVAAVDLAKAQLAQTQARIDELKITLGNTSVLSPVDGFVGRRNLDAGAFAGANTVILQVVDISTVRLVANVVERDFKRLAPGVVAQVEVDAFPGETFAGVVSRVAPVFDAATRTAPMEIEVANPGFRLKPGMYARVRLTSDEKADVLTVPRNALVDVEGRRGVFLVDGQSAKFQPVRTGLQDTERAEILEGLTEGQRVITVGALALRDGDRITPMNMPGGGRQGGRQGASAGGAPQGGGQASGQSDTGAAPSGGATEGRRGGGRGARGGGI
jgi:RND family efflux transporter MFP subunit